MQKMADQLMKMLEKNGYKQVVYCKDCKHHYKEGEQVVVNRCELNHNSVQSDEWFCADGERREDEAD